MFFCLLFVVIVVVVCCYRFLSKHRWIKFRLMVCILRLSLASLSNPVTKLNIPEISMYGVFLRCDKHRCLAGFFVLQQGHAPGPLVFFSRVFESFFLACSFLSAHASELYWGRFHELVHRFIDRWINGLYYQAIKSQQWAFSSSDGRDTARG